MTFVYSKNAAKTINRMNSERKRLVKEAIEKLPAGDTKRLKGYAVETYRLRIGGWRVLYSYSKDGKIIIEKISPRGQAYK